MASGSSVQMPAAGRRTSRRPVSGKPHITKSAPLPNSFGPLLRSLNMIAVNNESGCWPTRAQELILRAALLQGEPALASWNEWQRSVNLDVIDYGSHRVVPQLYRNLQRHGVKDPLLERLKGVYRYYLYKNEILMHRIGALLR